MLPLTIILFLQSTLGDANQLDPVLQSAIDKVADTLSHKQSNSSALAAVVEIRVETTVVSNAGMLYNEVCFKKN